MKTRALLYLYAGIACLYLLSSSGRINGRDALAMFKVTMNMADHGSLSSEPCDRSANIPQCEPGIDGHRYAVFGYLPSLAVLPGYELAKTMASKARVPVPVVAGFFVTAITALVAAGIPVAMAWWIGLMGFRSRSALLTAIAFAFGTPSWHHGVKALYSEPYMALMLILSAVLLLHGRGRGAWALAGLFLGLACSARIIAVLAVPAYSAIFAFRLRRGPSRLLNLLVLMAPAGAVLGVLGVLNRLHFGSFFRTGYGSAFPSFSVMLRTPIMDGLTGYLFGGDTSLLLFAPLFLLVPWGFVRLYRTNPLDTLLCLATFLFHTLFCATYEEWNVVWSYGPRLLVPVLAFAFIPLCTLFCRRQNPAWARYAVYGLLAISLVVNVVGNTYPLPRYLLMNAWASARAGKPVYLGCLKTMFLDLPSVLRANPALPSGSGIANPVLNDSGNDLPTDPAAYQTFDAFLLSFPNPINLETADFWLVKAGVMMKRPFLAGVGALLMLLTGLAFLGLAWRLRPAPVPLPPSYPQTRPAGT